MEERDGTVEDFICGPVFAKPAQHELMKEDALNVIELVDGIPIPDLIPAKTQCSKARAQIFGSDPEYY